MMVDEAKKFKWSGCPWCNTEPDVTLLAQGFYKASCEHEGCGVVVEVFGFDVGVINKTWNKRIVNEDRGNNNNSH